MTLPFRGDDRILPVKIIQGGFFYEGTMYWSKKLPVKKPEMMDATFFNRNHAELFVFVGRITALFMLT